MSEQYECMFAASVVATSLLTSGLGVWDWSRQYQPVSAVAWGEIAFAGYRPPQPGENHENQILTVGGKGARLWKTKTDGYALEERAVMVFRQQNAIRRVVFSHDSQRLVTAAADGTATIWELRNETWTEAFKLPS